MTQENISVRFFSGYQHADIVANHSMCSEFDVCVCVDSCMFLCAYEWSCYGTAGGLSKSR